MSSTSADNAGGSGRLAINRPSGIVSGFSMLASIVIEDPVSIEAPPGWSLIRSDGDANLYYHLADDTEPRSYVWSLGADAAAMGGIYLYSGVASATPIDSSGGQVNSSSMAITAPALTTDTQAEALVGFFTMTGIASIRPPAGFTERGEVSSNHMMVVQEVSDAIQDTAGGTGTVVARASAPAPNVGQLVALRPVFVAYSDGSYWNRPIPMSQQMDPNSDSYIGYIDSRSQEGYLVVKNTGAASTGGVPTYWVRPRDACHYWLKDDPPELQDVVIPLGVDPSTGDDGTMQIVNTDPRVNSVVWLWQALWNPHPAPCGTWSATGLSYHSLTSNGLDGSLPPSDEPDNTGHRGLAGLTFPIRCDEVRSGIISHVIKFVMPAPAQDEYWFPMVQTDGTGTARWAVPEGARLHIKYSADLSGLRGSALILARALQRYGMLLADSDSTDPVSPGTVQIGVEPSTLDGDPGCWQDLALTSDALASIPWSGYEVLPANYRG